MEIEDDLYLIIETYLVKCSYTDDLLIYIPLYFICIDKSLFEFFAPN